MRKLSLREVRRLTQGHTGLNEPKIYDFFQLQEVLGRMYLAPWEDLSECPEGLNCKGVFGEQARQQMQQHQPLGVKKGSVLTARPPPPPPRAVTGYRGSPISPDRGPSPARVLTPPQPPPAPPRITLLRQEVGSAVGEEGTLQDVKSLHPPSPGMEQACPRASQPGGWFPGASGKDRLPGNPHPHQHCLLSFQQRMRTSQTLSHGSTPVIS